MERYLTAAWDSGADPVVVLTKLDVCDDLRKLDEAEAVAVGVPVLAVSNVTGDGIDEVRALLSPARTFALLGSSGAGQVDPRQPPRRTRRSWRSGELRSDGRGRHTTRHRQLLVLRDGAILVDTPGLRELQIWEGDVDSAFSDVADVAARCRFNDCAHETEPGCAVQEALESGMLDPSRWASYLKLQRELGRVRMRRGSREHRELKRRWKARARETRRERRYGGKP